MSDDFITYVIGEDDEGEHTFLTFDFAYQVVAIVQYNKDRGENDVIVFPPVAYVLMAKLVQMHLNASGELIKDRPNVH